MKRILTVAAALLLLFLVVIALLGLTSSVSTRIPDGFKGEYRRIDGLNLRVWQQGTGRDVLLIHGLPGSIEDWDPVIAPLAERYRVTVYDRPGHGFSQYRESAANVPANVDIALELIEALNLKDVIAVGHSYGGTVVTEMASRRPERVAGYVSVAGAVKLEHGIDPVYYAIATPVIGPGFARLGNELVGQQMMQQGLERAFDPAPVPEGFVARRDNMWLKVKNGLTTAHEEVNLPADTESLDFAAIKSPFLLLHGKQDRSVPFSSNAEFAHKAVPHSRLVGLDGAGHMVQFTHPGELIRAIDQLALRLSGAATDPEGESDP